jgi:hypothetical protein
MSAEAGSALIKWSSLAFIVACVVVGLTGCLDARKTTAGAAAAGTPPPPAPVPVIDVTKRPSDVINAFGDNLLAAEKKYVGKRLRSTGMFRAVRRDDSRGPRHGRFYAVFYHGHESVYLSDPDQEHNFSLLKDREMITFEADLVGYNQDVPDTAYGIWLVYDNAKLVRAD